MHSILIDKTIEQVKKMQRKTRRQRHKWKKTLTNKWTILIISSILVATLLVYFFVFSHSTAVYEAIPHTAAIIDQLALTHPNATFIENVEKTLTSANFTVDYYNYSQITVDFYRQLPSKRYSLIILRVHSGIGQYSGLTSFYTSENYSDWAHYWEQTNKEVVAVDYVQNGPTYFAITSNFIKTSDACKNSTVIMMGCDGLNKTDMAEAFVEKGAKVYIGWDGSISPEHTDKATEQLLSNIVSKNQTIGEAIENAMKTVGSDPNYHQSKLTYYPLKAENYVITTSNSALDTNQYSLLRLVTLIVATNIDRSMV
jgi:hypothetical protein